MRKSLILMAFTLCLLPAKAQMTKQNCMRLDAVAQRQARATSDKLQAVTIKCHNAKEVAATIKEAGYHARALKDNLVTAVVPAKYLKSTLDKDERITKVYGSRKVYPFLDKAREEIGVSKIRNNTNNEFETPYTGKGILIAMIDGGFKYDHKAFQDANGNSRIKMIWNNLGFMGGEESEPTDQIPSGDDGYYDFGGHGTQTTNIAAGSVISENNYSGMAPEADIIMINLNREIPIVMEELSFINEYATKKGQPFVVNMSFGSLFGSHDGLEPYDDFINEMATEAPGRALVFAAGNFGNANVHISHTFQKDGEKVALAVMNDGPTIEVWGKATDGKEHFSVQAYKGLPQGNLTELSVDSDENCTTEICSYNNKQHFCFQSDEGDDDYIILVITGKAGYSFDAWCDQFNDFYSGYFSQLDMTSLKGDNICSIGSIGQCAANAFCVGNYVTRNNFSSMSGRDITVTNKEVGDLSESSSVGPTMNSEIRKPDIAAPGTAIITAGISDEESALLDDYIVTSVMNNGEVNYYTAGSGTSLAAPIVSGSMALWLQANPNLTCKQLHEIVETTARKDEFTGSEEWNPQWGYGKFDAYEGLKKALQLADETGIPNIYGGEKPVSLKKHSDMWQILFNNAEPNADITVCDQQGRVCLSSHFTQLQRGQEVTLPLHDLPAGIYVISINTSNSKLVRKLVVSK